MNPEKELLVEKCITNPVLKVVTAGVTTACRGAGSFRLPSSDLERFTGLNINTIKKAVEWLMRKGFLRSTHEGTYPQRGASYFFDDDLRTAFKDIQVVAFGSTASQMVERFEPKRVGCHFISTPRPGWVGDEWGTPLELNYARKLLEVFTIYVRNIEQMGDGEFELHRASRARRFGWGLRDSGGDSTTPSLLCQCSECKADYQDSLTTWTNYKSLKKQERKVIRESLSQIT